MITVGQGRVGWVVRANQRTARSLLRGTVRLARQLARSDETRDEAITVAAGTGLALAAASIVANVVGAGVVFVIAGVVLPAPPDLADPDRQRLLNLAVMAGYLVLSGILAAALSVRRLRPVLAWLLTDRAPDADEQRAALRYPLEHARAHAVLWLLAVPLFAFLNATASSQLAVGVAITVALGGLTTVAIGYLLVERAWRRVTAEALQRRPLERPALPGVPFRLVLVWVLASGVPLLGVLLTALGPIGFTAKRLTITIATLSAVAFAVGLLAQLIAARSVGEPLRAVRGVLTRVGEGELDVEVEVFDGGEIGLLQSGVAQMVAGLRERERMRDLFGRQVGSDVAAQALSEGPRLGGEVRQVAVLFVDIIGSTRLAASTDPTEVVELLNRFFAMVVHVVTEHDGLVNKFEGDAALCVFGAPGELDDPAAQALCAARSMKRQLGELPRAVAAGIGVSYGEAVAGWVGAESRYEYTVIGDPVNEAARLSDLAKEHRSCVLASRRCVEAAAEEEQGRWRRQGKKKLRGRRDATELAVPSGDADEQSCPHRGRD